jgi:hypothetical protein
VNVEVVLEMAQRKKENLTVQSQTRSWPATETHGWVLTAVGLVFFFFFFFFFFFLPAVLVFFFFFFFGF